MKIFKEIELFLCESGQQSRPPLIVILGSTASGKTALSLEVAKRFQGEIVSADSRQIYKYMNIGTEKISEEKMQGIPHHLLDIIPPDQEFSVADYKRLALKIIQEILRRKKVPILCGGTGLYLNAIIENYQIPQVPPQYDLRQQFAQYYEEHGSLALHALLKTQDPEAAARIHPHNVRYVIRALEINLAGKRLKQAHKGEPLFNIFSIGIDWGRELLYDRINRRVDEQINRGLLNEVKSLVMKGYHDKIPAMSSLGYLEFMAYLKGKITLEEASENMKRNTRNYAKRQLTWFRRYTDIHWVAGSELEEFLHISEKHSNPVL